MRLACSRRQWSARDGIATPCVELTKEQLFHHVQDDGPHPLDGVEIIVAGVPATASSAT